MTCLKGEGLDGPGMKSHTSMLRTFFVYTLALSMPIFKKKISPEMSGKKFQTFHCSPAPVLCWVIRPMQIPPAKTICPMKTKSLSIVAYFPCRLLILLKACYFKKVVFVDLSLEYTWREN